MPGWVPCVNKRNYVLHVEIHVALMLSVDPTKEHTLHLVTLVTTVAATARQPELLHAPHQLQSRCVPTHVHHLTLHQRCVLGATCNTVKCLSMAMGVCSGRGRRHPAPHICRTRPLSVPSQSCTVHTSRREYSTDAPRAMD